MEEEAVDIDWVPLADSLDEMDAEMARGYLEAQSIPVQLKSSNKGLSNYRGSVATAGCFLRVDLYVPHEALDSAILVLHDMPKVEPVIGDHEDFVLVYDEAGELQELDLSSSGKCPACGGIGIEHKVAEKGGMGLVVLVFFASGLFLLFWDWAMEFLGFSSYPGVTIIIILTGPAVALAYFLQGTAESWYCARCGQAWHK